MYLTYQYLCGSIYIVRIYNIEGGITYEKDGGKK